MSRFRVWIFIVVVVFFIGTITGRVTLQPEAIKVPQVILVPQIVYKVIEVPIVRHEYIKINIPTYPTEFRQFESPRELNKWQAEQLPELSALTKQNGWKCVDRALELQRRAWQEGYQMSVQIKDSHAICSTWIGNECFYLEPLSTISWLGAIKGK